MLICKFLINFVYRWWSAVSMKLYCSFIEIKLQTIEPHGQNKKISVTYDRIIIIKRHMTWFLSGVSSFSIIILSYYPLLC